ncbi:MAG TPA: DUF423 domain-containing protein [Xenococcaceae cyanobacterium]|jgi:uncharacterized membrane protein YgdD (TMEM256/DUF423 family)
MTKIFLAIASIFGGLAVALGAFASHALKAKLTPRALEIWETGTRYQMDHVLALILVALLLSRTETTSIYLNIAGIAFIVGMTLFSGSLYALSLSDIKWLGAITPLGGVAFILGWGCLAVAALGFK